MQELDGKDVTDSERKYLIQLISRKKIAGTVYNDVKKKQLNLTLEGQKFQIHEQKKYLMDNIDRRDDLHITFEEYQNLYGTGDEDEDIKRY